MAVGRRLSERLRDVENEKEDCKEEEKGLEKKEEESTDNSYTNHSERSVVNWKSEVEIEYAERRVVMSGKKKKKKKYGVVIKSFVLHKKKIGHTDVERQNVMKFLIQYKREVNTLEKNME